ncbi:MAG: hypothetical protein M3N13_02355 [Candidatus Eremiobacteraeota bacterium]|nr:hypothetical protein [Candidatus Eremiobacteraeota bacterium]
MAISWKIGRAAAATALVLATAPMAGCRTDDVIRNTSAFKDDAKTFTDLAAQVESDRRESCRRILVVQRHDLSLITSPPPQPDDRNVAQHCKTAFDQADDFAKSVDVLTAYFTGLAAAANGKAVDLNVGAITGALNGTQLAVLSKSDVSAINTATKAVADYLVSHARVVAIQAAVRSADKTLIETDGKIAAIFAPTPPTCDQRTYCGFLSNETKEVDAVYGNSIGMPSKIPDSYAERAALLTIRRDWDSYYDDQQKRIETGRKFAATFHRLVLAHNALLKLIDRTPESSEAVMDRL